MFFARRIPYTKKAIEMEKRKKEKSKNSHENIKTWDFRVRKKQRMDHAGLSFELETPNNNYIFSFYDIRHWNDEEDNDKDNEDNDENDNNKNNKIQIGLKFPLKTKGISDSAKTKILNNWIDRFDLEGELENEFSYSKVKVIVKKLQSNDPHIDIFNTLFPKINN